MAFALNLPKLVGGGTRATGRRRRTARLTQAATTTGPGLRSAGFRFADGAGASAMAETRVLRKVPLIGHLPMHGNSMSWAFCW